MLTAVQMVRRRIRPEPNGGWSAAGLPGAERGGHYDTKKSVRSRRKLDAHLDSEQKQEHDFSNMLSELGYAVLRQDLMMMTREEANNKTTAVIKAVVVAITGDCLIRVVKL